ncbi:mitochondrial inner membrane protease subunit 2 isoform X1 [Rhodamnia argentea]|uniref:Mitochondrial inner membrane protease subunit 2 n=1 Tax=Rhodamnia argentea TaxID=178133 RepID=A0A8B8PR32_9MYRT|nr:mitochondrial inner membrane protease subunit 2 isoform X1 [Rhodamnia argentea]XP_030537247.1 mitochondrial inner membrane protease subunit 2 isoform X1 [Rhodamnia argentea]XP_030537249.1 mitochondrial inner membrane protease subunit 2 isoform X1 [Rhodamnia argentea]XP_030537250.1 mitochondrial inner membrane protease subunit 2 isoform X1 [Rhodamnia argentea]XP_030537251.1 mitochondrial inner membrane protease subunit 2 isoform X1 [Rhodamnia argentea]XP_030537252.1 mitochondrial inner membr
MGTRSLLWDITKKYLTVGLVGLTISDRYASIVSIRGSSMSPAFNPGSDTNDYVLLEKFCLDKYRFSDGDVVVFSSPNNHKEKHIKRIRALPGDWIETPNLDVLKVPEGHFWVEGDNSVSSLDSRSFGPIPLGLIRGRVTHIVWPPKRMDRVERETNQRLSPIQDRPKFY